MTPRPRGRPQRHEGHNSTHLHLEMLQERLRKTMPGGSLCSYHQPSAQLSILLDCREPSCRALASPAVIQLLTFIPSAIDSSQYSSTEEFAADHQHLWGSSNLGCSYHQLSAKISVARPLRDLSRSDGISGVMYDQNNTRIPPALAY